MISVWWSSPFRTPLSISFWYCCSGVNKAENDKYGQEGPQTNQVRRYSLPCPKSWFKPWFVSCVPAHLPKMLGSTGSESMGGETDNDEYGVRPEDLDTEFWEGTAWVDELGPPELDTRRVRCFLGVAGSL